MKKKKILILSDDLRTHSGVGRVTFDLITDTLDIFDWVQIGAVIKHPEKGKRIDLSNQFKEANKKDCSVVLYPYDCFGDSMFLKYVIANENPDAILHFTDPRQFIWLYNMEHELRQKLPIFYYHVWDNYPQPLYNKPYYESCDSIMCISKLTFDVVNDVLGDYKENVKLEYIPHGINEQYYFPINDSTILDKAKQKFLDRTDYEFISFVNNRNIPRKNIPDIINAYSNFIQSLTPEQNNKCLLLLKTDPFDPNGTNLIEVQKVLDLNKTNKMNVIIIPNKLSIEELNLLYNISDVTINIAGQEGWGLSSTESLLSGTMIINNVTGGLQDQIGFKNYIGKYVSNITNKEKDVISNGDWCIPIYPSVRTIIGSQPTPYIYDDKINPVDLSIALNKIYKLSKSVRVEKGLKGREFAIKNKMTSKEMANSISNNITTLLNNWKPRKQFELIKL